MAGKPQANEEIEICSENTDQIVKEYSPMIKYVANRIAMRLPPHIEVDDLISVGAIGLMDAIEKYDPTRGAKFNTGKGATAAKKRRASPRVGLLRRLFGRRHS